MAKTQAPLLSFGAGGQIANSMVYSRWRGVPYVRRYVTPANPNTAKQQEVRNIFRTLGQMWLTAPEALIAAWDTYATGRPFVGRNAYTGQNVRVLNNFPAETDMANFIASPGARGGLAPTDMVITPASTSIGVSVVTPTPPSGWTLTNVHGIVFPDQAPASDFVGPFAYDADNGTPAALTFTGLEDDSPYMLAVWAEWLKPNEQTAYSVSLGELTATTA